MYDILFPINKDTFLLEDKKGYFISTKQLNKVSMLAILKTKKKNKK